MTNNIDLAIVGANTLAGETVLSLLPERDFPLGRLFTVDDGHDTASHVEFKDEPIVLEALADFNFEQVQVAIFLTDAAASGEFAPKATQCGCIVIDSSGAFNHDPLVPLVIAGVNDEHVDEFRESMIIATPSSATVQLLTVLKPIYDEAGIVAMSVTGLLPASQAGKAGQEELGLQTANLLNFKDIETHVFPGQLAFNVLGQAGEPSEDGFSAEERRLMQETQKILGDDRIAMQVTMLQVPVFFGSGEVVHLQTRDYLMADGARVLLENSPAIELLQASVTPSVLNVTGKDRVFVGRIRDDMGLDNGISLWIMVDNIRRGIAINSVQIAEILVKDYL